MASEGPPRALATRNTSQVPLCCAWKLGETHNPGNRPPCLTWWQLFWNNSSLINRKSGWVPSRTQIRPPGDEAGET